MNVVDCYVINNAYGRGKIIEQNTGIIIVNFDCGRKKFEYPKAFEKFLRFEDQFAQNEVEAELSEIRRKNKEKSELKQIKREESVGRTMKIKSSIPKEMTDNSFELIQTVTDLRNNIDTLDSYIEQKRGEEFEFALNLIKKGTCFVVLNENQEYKFYPSRFVGYKDNSMAKHESNMNKDGRVTNPQINRILHSDGPQINGKLEAEYINYCVSLGISPSKSGNFGAARKYWIM